MGTRTADATALGAASLGFDATAFREAPFPYLVLSAEGLIIEANAAAATFLDAPPSGLAGWPLLRFVAPDDRRAYLDFLYHAGRAPHHAKSLDLKGPAGLLPVRLHTTRTTNTKGAALFFTAIEDLRELRAAEASARTARALVEQRVAERNQELAAANDALREKIGECGRLELELRYKMQELSDADRAKDEFIAMLAHELRNPLAPIRNAVEVLKRKEISDRAVQWARDLIDRQVEHLKRLVDDLLDVSRIARGKIDLQRIPVDVAEVVERAVELSQPGIAVRHHHLDVRMPEAPVHVEGDRERLAQALANILNNAAKYTAPGGRIALDVRQDGSEARITVRDTGQGISDELLPRIFDAFTQGDRGLDRAEGGLGIGLTLVKRIIELHGGRVEARSEGPGRGAEFELRTPCCATVEASPSPQGRGADRPAPRRRVLVVDDNADAAETLMQLLELEGHQVRTACEGAAALRIAADFHPDALLLDIGLPGIDGRELARALRARPDTRDALIVAISGYGREEDIQRSRAAGFDHHLVKPVDLAALEAVLAGSASRTAT
jgi:signal transduction histidine kinase/ActR/RegA family two-component response regulator